MIKTKQELLNHFSDINAMYNNPFMYQTLSNMIDELLEQQPCEDCISRDEAIKEFQVYREYSSNMSNVDWVDRIETVLIQLPSVTPKRPKGNWKPLNYKDEMWGYVYKCSNCGATDYGYNYCSNCGAKMAESEDKE